ncbi:MAG: amidohydrolase [Acidobacteriaceae bacterium]
MQIIDTHQHLWDLDRFRYSWLQEYPTLNRSFRMNDYLEATKGLNVVKSVHLEADVDEPFMWEETSYLLELSNQEDNPLEGIVACGRPERKDFRSYLEKIAGHSKIKGIRRVLHTQPDDLGQKKIFLENVAALAAYDLSFDICVLARQLPTAIHLVSYCKDVTFILDHCGIPPVKDKILDPWRLHIAELAKFPNVSCKVSGLVSYANPATWTADDLRPYVEHVIACFGWDRVLFGSDWPVCTLSASYVQWVDVLCSMTVSAGQTQQRKLFHENALRVYRLG